MRPPLARVEGVQNLCEVSVGKGWGGYKICVRSPLARVELGFTDIHFGT